jgi:hypothetical protein
MFESMTECHVQAVGEKGNKDMRLDALLVPMEDRTDRQIALERLERFFDGDQLQVVLPELAWIGLGQVRAQ